MYEYLPNLNSTTSMLNLFSSTTKQFNHTTNGFIRILVIIAIISLLFFMLIIFIIAILIKSHRFRISSSSEDKVSSSSFAQSISTAISTDFCNDIYQFKQEPIISLDYSRRYENYLTARPSPPFIHGLVPQTNLSPRFYRQYHGFDERRRRRAPVHVQSPSLSSINPYIDHGLLTSNKYNNTKNRTHLPSVARLQNGDVLISA